MEKSKRLVYGTKATLDDRIDSLMQKGWQLRRTQIDYYPKGRMTFSADLVKN